MISDKQYDKVVKALGGHNIRAFFDPFCMEVKNLKSDKSKVNYVVQLTLNELLDDAIEWFREVNEDRFEERTELIQGSLMGYFMFMKTGKLMFNPQFVMADKYKNLDFEAVVQLFKDSIDEYVEQEGLGNVVRNAWTNPKNNF